uniref:hypothetical protein n=1 Tax=Photobacterium halotolerans TaxID=265726 RepID=UPI00055CD54C
MGYYRTQGLADGFMQGFGLVDDYQNRQFQQDRQKAADVRAEESHDQNMASGKLELENAGLRLQKNQFDVDHMGEMHTARMGEIELGNKVKNAQLAREKFLQKKEQFEYDAKESLTLSDSILAAVNSGHSLNDDMITKVIESSKKPGSLFFAFGADLEKGKEINRVNTAFFNGEIPLSQALPSLQARFDPYVQELIGERDLKSGKEIVRAQVTDFNMTDQKNLKGTPMVTVTYADGTNATRPVTEHRLAGGDDKPIELGIDQIMQQQIADRQFLAYMAATGLDKKLKDGITALRTKAQPGKETPLQGDVRETFAGLMKQYNKAAAGKTDEMGSTYTPANPEEMAAITANIDRMAMQYPDMAKAYGW